MEKSKNGTAYLVVYDSQGLGGNDIMEAYLDCDRAATATKLLNDTNKTRYGTYIIESVELVGLWEWMEQHGKP